ncbi:MAG: hypothetical protein RIT19_1235 [Verrucomicrobiota bacterium]
MKGRTGGVPVFSGDGPDFRLARTPGASYSDPRLLTPRMALIERMMSHQPEAVL